jgi:hypothetical protein
MEIQYIYENSCRVLKGKKEKRARSEVSDVGALPMAGGVMMRRIGVMKILISYIPQWRRVGNFRGRLNLKWHRRIGELLVFIFLFFECTEERCFVRMAAEVKYGMGPEWVRTGRSCSCTLRFGPLHKILVSLPPASPSSRSSRQSCFIGRVSQCRVRRSV